LSRTGMRALWFGDAAQDALGNGEEVIRLSAAIKGRGAYRLKEELGTQPSVLSQPSVLYLPSRGGVSQ
jgi:hypothetical protein